MPATCVVQQGGSDGYAWVHATRPVPASLARFVLDIHGFSERASTPIVRTEYTVPFVVVIIEIGPPLLFLEGTASGSAGRHDVGFVAGIGEKRATMEADRAQAGIHVDLTPIGARFFFGRPLSELSTGSVSLGDVLPEAYRTLHERLAEVESWDARFDFVEQLLYERLGHGVPDLRADVVAWALAHIEERGGDVDIARLARELGYSEKHVTRLFREYVGVAPKLHARIVRFHRFMEALRQGHRGSFADLAADLGFFDQSHLARDVRLFTGMTPQRVAAGVAAWPAAADGSP